MSAKKKFGSPAKQKAYIQALKNSKVTDPSNKVHYLGNSKGSVCDAAADTLAIGYDYVISCDMGPFVLNRGCYRRELEEQYHSVLVEAYTKKAGHPVMVVNSKSPSGKVITQSAIEKELKKSIHIKNLKAAQFKGGSYKSMLIFSKA